MTYLGRIFVEIIECVGFKSISPCKDYKVNHKEEMGHMGLCL